ncbi:MAG TPA: hypothetical protein VGN72_10610 [Tepidisphaeraceae bacterium]|jgi:hypothetical protein|nr:hypothetical protein [Tepidisphaeraceae bacterium]
MPLNRFCEPLERRRLLSSTIVASGLPATVTDGDGTQVMVRLTGPGSVTLTPDGDAFDLTFDAAVGPTTSLLIKSRGGADGLVTLDDITAAQPLARITATGARLTGEVTLPRVGRMTVHEIDGARIDAGRIDHLQVRGDVVGATMWVRPPDSRPERRPVPPLGRLTIRGTMGDSTVDVAGTVGTVSVGAMIDSNVVAGIAWLPDAAGTFAPVLPRSRPDEERFFAKPDEGISDRLKEVRAALRDFTGHFTIRSLTVTGRVRAPLAFAGSKVAAHDIDRITLNKVARSDDAPEYGVVAYEIGVSRYRYESLRDYRARGGDVDGRSFFNFHQLLVPPDPPEPPPGPPAVCACDSGLIGTPDSGAPSQKEAAYPVDGDLKVAMVVDSPEAAALYLLRDETIDVRSADGAVLRNEPNLPAAIYSIVGQPGVPITQSSDVLFLSTAGGPKVQLMAELLHTAYRLDVVTEFRHYADVPAGTLVDAWTPTWSPSATYQHVQHGFAGPELRAWLSAKRSDGYTSFDTVPEGFQAYTVTAPAVSGWVNLPPADDIAPALRDLGATVRVVDGAVTAITSSDAIAFRWFDRGRERTATFADGRAVADLAVQIHGARGSGYDAKLAERNGQTLVYALGHGGTVILTAPDGLAIDAAGELWQVPNLDALRKAR